MNKMNANKFLQIKCPHCNREFNYYQSDSRPFCSEKCKMVDLGHWFEESYVVPVGESDKGMPQEIDQKENEDGNEGESENESEIEIE